MTLPVHWVESLAGVGPGDEVEVEGDEAHHAVAVRRLREGERLVLTDGAGTTLTGAVRTTGKRRLTVVVDDVLHVPEPEPRVTVVQALPKGDRGELAVEVLTEVGAATVVPWAAARSVAVWRGERAEKSLARWRATAREAAKQSRRAWFPVVGAAGVDRGGLPPGRRGRPGARAPRGGHDRPGCPARGGTTARWSWSSGPRAGSPTTRWRRSRPPALTPYDWVTRCCAPRPPASWRWPRCWRGPPAGLLDLDRPGVDVGLSAARAVAVPRDQGVLAGLGSWTGRTSWSRGRAGAAPSRPTAGRWRYFFPFRSR